MRTRLERDPQQMAQCIYSIPYECGRSYIGETDKPLAMQLCEHVWIFLPYGSPLSAMRLATHREDQYDLTHFSWVPMVF
jgi:hypothetical protein